MRINDWIPKVLSVLRSGGANLVDMFPPYKRVEGQLRDKGTDSHGEYNLLVEDQIVLVDWLTCETLIVGEPLRILMTRTNRAISIDRVSP